MRKDDREQIGLIGDQTFKGDIRHIGIGFQLRKDVFLRTSSVVEFNDLSGACCFVGENDLVGKAEFLWNKKVQLDWFLGLHNLFCTDEKETVGPVPGFWLPRFLEEGGIGATGCPTLT